jgi:hypothetical protein
MSASDRQRGRRVNNAGGTGTLSVVPVNEIYEP